MKANFNTRGLGLALALGLGLLVLSLVLAGANMDVMLDSRVAHWIGVQQIFGPQLIWPFVGYGLAVLLVHLVFGSLLWLLALMSGKAMNSRGWSRRTHVVVWFVILVFWIFLGNAAFFPWSLASSPFRILVQPVVGDVTTFELLTGALLLAVLICSLRIVEHVSAARRLLPRAALYAFAIVVVVSSWQWISIDAAINRELDPASRPNIIIVGIDSLRPDFVGASGQELGYTPELDLFLSEATLFTDAITPLARTFGSWMAILTGRAPVTTGVRDNLVQRSVSQGHRTLADHLRAAGYRTAYATDEVRFSNIDESYGFDQVISPRMGITDFILGTFNDLPLTNLVANSWVAKLLFPDTYANRAAATTYRPETFVDRLEDDLDFAEPGFVSVHLTLPHYPYHWMQDDDSVFSRTTDLKYQYSASVVAADRQFASVMRMFEQRGMLRNAIVVVLSDHGEGLGLPRDNAIYSKAAKQAAGRIRVSMAGHGNSVLSPSQYSVVLAMRGYGPAARLVGSTRRVDVPVSLEDVMPTLLELSGVTAEPDTLDGHSLAAVLRDWPNIPADRYARVRYTETGFPVDFAGGTTVDEKELAARAIDQFTVDRQTRRVVLREESIPALLRIKQRAAIKGEWILAALPAGRSETRYLLVDRRGEQLPRMLDAKLAAADPTAAVLWNALHEHFDGELHLVP